MQITCLFMKVRVRFKNTGFNFQQTAVMSHIEIKCTFFESYLRCRVGYCESVHIFILNIFSDTVRLITWTIRVSILEIRLVEFNYGGV
jgi:hypothetical protein